MRLTLRHVYDFGADRDLVGDDLVRRESWDALRTRTDGPFALATDREAWRRAAQADPALNARADAIDRWLDQRGVASVASYGVGTAGLECLLQERSPDREMTVTDFGPETVKRLGELFDGVHVQRHDLLHDPPVAADAHLMHRVDTELDDRQWREVLARFSGELVLVVATAVLTPRDVLLSLLSRARNRGQTRAGWARTGSAFEALWPASHEADRRAVGDLVAWELSPR